jgi:hypothetical protein
LPRVIILPAPAGQRLRVSTPDNDVVYPNTEKFALCVRCKSGKVKAIEAGPGFSNEELKILKAKVASELVASPVTKIERAILFSSHPVKGCYRSGVRLQIGDAPESAPKPPVVKADHPFVLEFPLRQSSDEFITVQRRSRQTLEWTWFLNAVLRTRIKAIGPRAEYHWVATLSGNQALTQADVIWGQEFYTIDGFKTQDEEFSACGEPHIATIPVEEYYATAVYRERQNWLDTLRHPTFAASVGRFFAQLLPKFGSCPNFV